MYYISKRMEIAGSHQLNLDYPSKCTNLHGHNWIITVHCKSELLNANGMVIDFTDIKKLVSEKLDHKNLTDLPEFYGLNTTAEYIARTICDMINKKLKENYMERLQSFKTTKPFATLIIPNPMCWKVEVQESEGNTAVYEEGVE